MRRLTRKQKAFVDKLVENPKMSATQAALQTYGSDTQPPTYLSARQIASDNLNNPTVMDKIDKLSGKAIQTIEDIMDKDYQDSRSPADTRLKAAQDLADRALGKATQTVINKNVTVNLELDLSTTTSATTE